MGTVTSINARNGNRVALLLNAQARKVDARLQAELARFVPQEDVYLSRTFDDARRIARTVLDRGYRTLLVGGGDGSFVGFANMVLREQEALGGLGMAGAAGGAALRLQPEPLRLPRFGVLKLGTGNALAGLVGASDGTVGVVEDVLRARTGDVSHSRPIHLVDADGKLAPFAGLGYDASVLNDYRALHRWVGNTPLQLLGSGMTGYLLAAATRSVPRQLLSRECPEVTVTNEGGMARQIAPDGREIGRPIEPGEVIYKGPCRLAAVGTVPCYGFGFTLFPHAPKSTRSMQLRLTAMPLGEVLRNLPAIWKGRTPSAGVLDFHVDRVRIAFDRPMPFQVGGDAEGDRTEVTLGVDSREVELLDFRPRG